MSRRTHTKEFKLAAVQRLERGSTVGEVARDLGVNPGTLRGWRHEVRQRPGIVLPDPDKHRWTEERIVDMEREIRRKILEFEFLKGCLQHFEDQRGRGWEFAVCQRIQEEVRAKRGLTIDRMVQLGRISRSRLYRDDNSESDAAVNVGSCATRDAG